MLGYPLSLIPWFFGASKPAPFLWKRIQALVYTAVSKQLEKVIFIPSLLSLG